MIIETVPNFSEGRNRETLEAIAKSLVSGTLPTSEYYTSKDVVKHNYDKDDHINRFHRSTPTDTVASFLSPRWISTPMMHTKDSTKARPKIAAVTSSRAGSVSKVPTV